MKDRFRAGGKDPEPPLTGMTRKETADGIRDHVTPDAGPREWPKVDPPKVDFDEDEGSGLEFPTVALPGVTPPGTIEDAFGAAPKPEEQPPLRAPDDAIFGLFSPKFAPILAILTLLALGVGGYFVLGRPAEQAPGAANPLAPAQPALPATPVASGAVAVSAAIRIVASEAIVERTRNRARDDGSPGGIRDDCRLTLWFVWKLSREPITPRGYHVAYQGDGLPREERAPIALGPRPDLIVRVLNVEAKSGVWSAALDVTENGQRVTSPSDPGATIRVDGSCQATGKRWLPAPPSLLPASAAILRYEGDYYVRGAGASCARAYEQTFSLVVRDRFDPTAPALLTVHPHSPVPGANLEGVVREDGTFRFEQDIGGTGSVSRLVYEGRATVFAAVVGDIEDRIEYVEMVTRAGSTCQMTGGGPRL